MWRMLLFGLQFVESIFSGGGSSVVRRRWFLAGVVYHQLLEITRVSMIIQALKKIHLFEMMLGIRFEAIDCFI